MKVTYKLVGIKGEYYFTKEHDTEFVNLNTFKSDITKIGFDGNHDNIIFITQSKTVKSDDIKFTLDQSIVFVFSKDIDIKIKLKEVFEKNCDNIQLPKLDLVSSSSNNSSFSSIPMQNIKKKIEVKIPTLDDEEMIQHNKETLEILKKDKFKTLMEIYHNEPELLSFFHNYVTSGNIVDIQELKEVEDELTEEESKVFLEVKSLVTSFSFETDDNMIKKLIRGFDGNCSLIFRYIYQTNLTSK
tara:strand:- start:4610 stop:5338 length:729 start_codon:yes stop_codon:yes gene_type:complete